MLQQRMEELSWRNGGKASSELYGEVAVVDRCVAYIWAWGDNRENEFVIVQLVTHGPSVLIMVPV